MQYIYDLSVGDEIILRPNDEEVEGFELMPLHEVKKVPLPFPLELDKYVLAFVSRSSRSSPFDVTEMY